MPRKLAVRPASLLLLVLCLVSPAIGLSEPLGWDSSGGLPTAVHGWAQALWMWCGQEGAGPGPVRTAPKSQGIRRHQGPPTTRKAGCGIDPLGKEIRCP
jgi:hypothetical protein